MKYAIVAGDPINGFEVYGPFEREQEAFDLLLTLNMPRDCWVTLLQSEEQFKSVFS